MLFIGSGTLSAKNARRHVSERNHERVKEKQRQKQKQKPQSRTTKQKQSPKQKRKPKDEKQKQKPQSRTTSETPSSELTESVQVLVNVSDVSSAEVETTFSIGDSSEVTVLAESSPEGSAVGFSATGTMTFEQDTLQQFVKKTKRTLLFLPKKIGSGIVFLAKGVKRLFWW